MVAGDGRARLFRTGRLGCMACAARDGTNRNRMPVSKSLRLIAAAKAASPTHRRYCARHDNRCTTGSSSPAFRRRERCFRRVGTARRSRSLSTRPAPPPPLTGRRRCIACRAARGLDIPATGAGSSAAAAAAATLAMRGALLLGLDARAMHASRCRERPSTSTGLHCNRRGTANTPAVALARNRRCPRTSAAIQGTRARPGRRLASPAPETLMALATAMRLASPPAARAGVIACHPRKRCAGSKPNAVAAKCRPAAANCRRRLRDHRPLRRALPWIVAALAAQAAIALALHPWSRDGDASSARRGDSDDSGRRRAPATAGRRRANAANTAHRRTRTAEVAPAPQTTTPEPTPEPRLPRPPLGIPSPPAPSTDTETAVTPCPPTCAAGAAAAAAEHACMWDPDPAKRFVILDGERWRRRQRRPDADPPHRRRGVLFDWDGRSIRLPIAEEPMPGIDLNWTAISSNSTSSSLAGLCESGGAGSSWSPRARVRVDGAVELRKTREDRAEPLRAWARSRSRDRGLKPASRSARAGAGRVAFVGGILAVAAGIGLARVLFRRVRIRPSAPRPGSAGRGRTGNNFTRRRGSRRRAAQVCRNPCPARAGTFPCGAGNRFRTGTAQPFQVSHRVRAPQRLKECSSSAPSRRRSRLGTVIIRSAMALAAPLCLR